MKYKQYMKLKDEIYHSKDNIRNQKMKYKHYIFLLFENILIKHIYIYF